MGYTGAAAILKLYQLLPQQWKNLSLYTGKGTRIAYPHIWKTCCAQQSIFTYMQQNMSQPAPVDPNESPLCNTADTRHIPLLHVLGVYTHFKNYDTAPD